jgi:hypothetical protein
MRETHLITLNICIQNHSLFLSLFHNKYIAYLFRYNNSPDFSELKYNIKHLHANSKYSNILYNDSFINSSVKAIGVAIKILTPKSHCVGINSLTINT